MEGIEGKLATRGRRKCKWGFCWQNTLVKKKHQLQRQKIRQHFFTHMILYHSDKWRIKKINCHFKKSSGSGAATCIKDCGGGGHPNTRIFWYNMQIQCKPNNNLAEGKQYNREQRPGVRLEFRGHILNPPQITPWQLQTAEKQTYSPGNPLLPYAESGDMVIFARSPRLI